VRLVVERIVHPSPRRRWRGHEELPDWVAGELAGDDVLAPGGALRGAPAGGWRLTGARRFLRGWVVVRGGAPVLVHRRRGTTSLVDLGGLRVTAILDQDLFRRVDLSDGPEGGSAFLLFGTTGPSVESLRAEFLRE